MKLDTLKQILTEMPPPQRMSGNVTSYGMILVNPSAYKVDYDEIEGIKVYTDKNKFTIALAKLYAEFSNNEDDVFLTYEELCEKPDFDAFCEQVWHWNLFR